MPLTPSTEWKEVVAPDEAARFEEYAELLHQVQLAQARKNPLGRALHVKPQACAEASFTVLPDLPEPARHGLGAQPGTYRALVRFSNGGVRRQSDQLPDVRGIAVKVIGVKGKKLIPGMEDAVTQDFLAILGVATPFRNAREFVWLVRNGRSPATLPFKAVAEFGPVRAVVVLRKLLKTAGRKKVSVAVSQFSSQLPIQWGPYAVRYTFAPRVPADASAALGTGATAFGDELTTRLARGPVDYDFRIQFFVDEQRTPIEDSSAEWKEADSPFVTVGRLTLPTQEVGKLAEQIEALSFDPWHALVEHRPLGDMMRARSAAYRVSTRERKAAPEPT